MKSTPFGIGTTKLNPQRIDQEFVTSAKEAVEGSKVRKGKTAAARILDEWTPGEPISTEQYEKLDDYVSNVHREFDKLENRWWKLQNSDKDASKAQKELEEKMGVEGEVLMHHQKIGVELREAGARAAVQAMAGTLSGAPGLVAAYSAYANSPHWTGTETKNTEKVLHEVGALNEGKSKMVTTGNQVEQVNREKLWKKMNEMLDDSIEKAKSGEKTEVDVQLYELTSFEMIDKLADSARAGNKVRLNLDPGRLNYPSRDSDGETYFSLDATPDKIRTILQLATLPDADIAVSLFPQKKLLRSPTDLMHRKVLRVGDKVLVSGMNANLGSGENVDSGYVVEGEAAAKLGAHLARDVQKSKGATLDDIWGQNHIDKFGDTNLRLGVRGFVSLIDCVGGPSEAGTRLPQIDTVEDLEKMAKKAGLKFRDLVAVSAEDYQSEVSKMLSGRSHLQLSEKGKKLLQNTIQRAIEVTTTPRNLSRLDDMKAPQAGSKGATRVDVADTPVEREALVLSAISQAEEFAYLPGFVVTSAVAAALAERRDQLKADGKEFDVKVVADAGLYPHGSNPNSYGVRFLEDHGIQPRWAKLERSGDHDRKIHAKQLITDKGEITGSTNFSTQGLRQNWETSAYVHFNDQDKSTVAARKESVAEFQDLWDNSFELNTKDHSALLNRDKSGPGRDWFVEEGREQSVRLLLRMIGNYERESGKLNQDLLHNQPGVAERKAELMAQGYSYGDSTLMAVKEVVGEKKHRAMLDDMGTAQTLRELQSSVAANKDGKTVADTSPQLFAPAPNLFY